MFVFSLSSLLTVNAKIKLLALHYADIVKPVKGKLDKPEYYNKIFLAKNKENIGQLGLILA